MRLIVTEKPSVARQIAEALGVKGQGKGYISGRDVIVTWCYGHLLRAKMPEEYDPNLDKWRREDLPIFPETFSFLPIDASRDQLKTVLQLMLDPKVEEIIEATDAGREGELIFRLVYEASGVSKPGRRLWLSSLEEGAIQKGLDEAQELSHYDQLYESARARMEADWLFGINLTRLYTDAFNTLTNIGRVKTPTLGLLVERDLKVESHVESFHYRLNFLLRLKQGLDLDVRSDKIEDESHARALVARLKTPSDLNFILTSMDVKERYEMPPRPFDLGSLQKEMNRRYGFKAQETLDVLQALYEKKLVTYPRTDAKYFTSDLRPVIERVSRGLYPRHGLENLDRVIDDSKVTDHHAIMPTETYLNNRSAATSLAKKEKLVLSVILQRFLQSTMARHEYRELTLVFKNPRLQELEFKRTLKLTSAPGFKALERSAPDAKAEAELRLAQAVFDALPSLTTQTAYPAVKPDFPVISKHKDPAPNYYTEAGLLSAMERVGKDEIERLMDEHDDFEVERAGIGTSATRSSIIEELIKGEFVKRQGKNLVTTEKSRTLIRHLPDTVKDPLRTAAWEERLFLIARGEDSREAFIRDLKEELASIIREEASVSRPSLAPARPDRVQLGPCPVCAKDVVVLKDYYACEDRSCPFIIKKKHPLWRALGKREITQKQARDLLSEGRCYVPKCKSKKGNIFDCYMNLRMEGDRVQFDMSFPERKRRQKKG